MFCMTTDRYSLLHKEPWKHDDLIREIKRLQRNIKLGDVVKCFVSSLSNHRLDLRSYLSSYVLATNLPSHKYTIIKESQGYAHADYYCGVCGSVEFDEDIMVNNLHADKLKYGGVNLLAAKYILFDLQEFQTIIPPEPSEKDIKILKELIDIIRNLNESERISILEKKLAPVLKSNKWQRRGLPEILAIIGVLYVDGVEHFGKNYVWESKRFWALSDVANDWKYPIFWWGRKPIKVDENTLKYYFREYL